VDEKILSVFRERQGEYVSGEELSDLLDVSRASIWKHIEKLRQEGYKIDAVPHHGYMFVSAPDKLLAQEVSWGIKTRYMGKKVFSYDVADSTNEIAYDLAKKGAPEGSVVVAEGQRRGKGRMGRSWISPKGGIYLSAILRPNLFPNDIPKITLMCAISVCTAIRDCSGLDAKIRWPNDILVEGKKICGILTEMKAEQDRIDFIIVGIGINVNTPASALPKVGTSIKEEVGKKFSRIELTRKLLESLEVHYEGFKKDGFAATRQHWRDLSATLGRRVKADLNHKKIEGQAQDIDEDGALLIRLDNGFIERLLSGDVILVR